MSSSPAFLKDRFRWIWPKNVLWEHWLSGSLAYHPLCGLCKYYLCLRLQEGPAPTDVKGRWPVGGCGPEPTCQMLHSEKLSTSLKKKCFPGCLCFALILGYLPMAVQEQKIRRSFQEANLNGEVGGKRDWPWILFTWRASCVRGGFVPQALLGGAGCRDLAPWHCSPLWGICFSTEAEGEAGRKQNGKRALRAWREGKVL